MIYIKLKQMIVLMLVAGLMACGGGGGGGATAGGGLSGTAATGKPIAGLVFVKDANGVVQQIGTQVNGSFTLNATGLTPPLLLKVVPTNGSAPLYSYASSVTQTINITPLTSLALFLGNNKADLGALYATWNGTGITAAAIASAQKTVNANFANQLRAAGVNPASYDFMTTPFTANSTGVDGFLDTLRLTINQQAGTFTTSINAAPLSFNKRINTAGINIGAPVVAETIPPVVTVPANITVAAAKGATTVAATQATIAAFLTAATATDNTAVVGPITHNAPATFPAGTTTVTFSAADAAGNTGTATATVTVTVNVVPTNPTITSLTPASGAVGSTVTINGTNFISATFPATAVTFGGNIQATGANIVSHTATQFVVNVPAGAQSGPITIQHIPNGPSVSTANFTITTAGGGAPADVTPPVVTPPANITVTAAQGATSVPATQAAIATFLGAATATDNVAVVGTITNNAPANFPVGVTTVTFSVSDAARNTGTATATITVNAAPLVDATPPTVTPPANITVTAAKGATSVPATQTAIATFLGAATATDNVAVVGAITNNAPANFLIGATTVTFSASDAAGNTGTATATVTVNAAPAPGGASPLSAFCPATPNNVPPTLNGWKWANPSPQGASLLAVAEGNGVFVAAGASGQMVRSTDRVNWTVVDSGTRSKIDNLSWDGNVFYAFASKSSTTPETILSCDGITWAKVPFNITFDPAIPVRSRAYSNVGIHSPVFINGNYFATDGSLIYKSTDGLNWAASLLNSPVNPGLILQLVSNGTNTIVALGRDGLYTSTDSGITWQKPATTPVFNYTGYGFAKKLVWTGSQFAIYVSKTELSTSTDGLTWTPVVTNSAIPAFNVVYHPEMIYFNGTAIMYGGNDFTQVTSYNNNAGFYLLDATNNWIEGDWHSTNQRALTKVNDAIVTSANTLLVVGDGGMIAEQTGASVPSQNAVNRNSWTRRSGDATPGLLTSIATNGTSYVAVGTETDILYSIDGITWTRPVLPTFKFAIWSPATPVTGEIGQVQWTGTQYVALGDTGMILTSVDGQTWVIEKKPGTSNALPTPDVSTFFNGTLFWNNSFRLRTRTAVNTYGTVDPSAGAPLIGGAGVIVTSGFADNGTRLVSVGNYGITTTLDGVTWVSSSLANILNSANFEFTGVAFNGVKFLAIANYSVTDPITNITTVTENVLQSLDGLAWTQITTFPNGKPLTLGSTLRGHARNILKGSNGKFMAFGSTIANSSPRESLDGITWTDSILPQGSANNSIDARVYDPTGSYWRRSWGDFIKTPTHEILTGFRNGILVK
ncbi:HYR domain-containing protein [Mariprofundus sp. EBB-1]|uniref:beta strand repeat-containing protein n=1 Tax=Mariprofundus sp. EBB-1 TaxID=2650971 RepID=UPI000EF22E39|nr:HYR domain-containing protein [Mariprofundus sp. EBB-1]RLL51570.1 HYR domain-containing protein [Mariprofundus sp. EBB-1]